MKPDHRDSPAILAGHLAAQRFFAPCFAEPSADEQLWVAHVDDHARCLHLGRYDGSASEVSLPVRDILKDAVRLGSAGVVLAHNHPSGDATPSKSDYRATRALATAGEALDLVVVDHLIFGRGECSSLRRMGML